MQAKTIYVFLAQWFTNDCFLHLQ